jgi:hypothetical protein
VSTLSRMTTRIEPRYGLLTVAYLAAIYRLSITRTGRGR